MRLVQPHVYLCLHSQHAWFLIKPSVADLLLGKKKWALNPSCMRIFILTVSLFGVISGVYCECRLTCHCVWRCATVLEYILVRCESVCGCINVCRAPPASLQAELAHGRICAAASSCALQDASRAAAPGTRAALYLLTGRPLPSPAAACMCATPAQCNQTHR